jgi:hypothetical protein
MLIVVGLQMNKLKLNSIVVAATLIALSVVSFPISASADTINKNECFPAVLMLKGSGEGIGENGEPVKADEYFPQNSPGTKFIDTNGHEGLRISRLLQEFVNKTDPAKTVSKVRFVGIEYPALPVFPEMPDFTGSGLDATQQAVFKSAILAKHIIDYNESYRIGAQMTVDFINNDRRNGCNTKYMLTSYSQGVIAARLAINLLGNNTNTVVSSYVFGDPFQKPNGAVSSRQKTVANTSPHTAGVGRIAASVLKTALGNGLAPPLSSIVSAAGVNAINDYTNEITQADPVIYNEDSTHVSRSLCHTDDPTCGISDLFETEFEEHTNYFNPNLSKGRNDIAYEVSEFDKQVAALANTATSNPRERSLEKTPSVAGKTTTYNVTNVRSDDVCAWDEGDNGTVENRALCSTYNVSHLGDKAVMKVTVTDSFGIQYVYRSSTDVIVPIPDIPNVPDVPQPEITVWSQFEPHTIPEAYKGLASQGQSLCLNGNHTGSTAGVSSVGIGLKPCAQGIVSHANSTTLFREKFDGFHHFLLVWGYDKWFWLNNLNGYSPNIALTYPDPDMYPNDFRVSEQKVVNGNVYYTIRNINQCVTVSDSGVRMALCEANNNSQLFIVHRTESTVPYS